jgi:hypothetical protein
MEAAIYQDFDAEKFHRSLLLWWGSKASKVFEM